MAEEKILIIDDQKNIRETLSDILSENNYHTYTAASGSDGVEKAEQEYFDIVITDLKLPDFDGIEVLKKIKKNNPEVIVILMTAFASVNTAIEAMKQGAFDYITKPFNTEELIIIIEKALSRKKLISEIKILKNKLKLKYDFDKIVGNSPAIQKVFRTIEKVSSTTSTVLISGPSGTGKELVARTIHFCSSRSDKPFITVNCGAIPQNLIESELFGHTKGAFTGAIEETDGLICAAENGTFFIDEIGDLALPTQAKLLRVLQEKEIQKIGTSEIKKVNVRFIAATNKDLEKEVSSGNFREDLFYRINVVPIKIPPLKERKDDIPLLIDHFIKKYSAEINKPGIQFSKEAVELMMQYNWPGNIRELENAVERAVTLSEKNIISTDSLPEQVKSVIKEENFGPISLDELTKRHIKNILNFTNDNKSRAADILKIHRSTLYRLIKQYALE